MLSQSDLDKITRLAQKHNVEIVLLFGSAIEHPPDETNDIDLGVRGLAPGTFFQFYGELMRLLDKPVDLIDLSKDSPFVDHVLSKGVRIYG